MREEGGGWRESGGGEGGKTQGRGRGLGRRDWVSTAPGSGTETPH